MLLGIGYLAGYIHTTQTTRDLISNIKPIRENNFNYKFIYPLLRYDFGNARSFLEDTVLESKLANYISEQYRNKNAQSISVYFSDLSTNRWSGVNEDIQYHPGSMMKVLIMMAYYRESQLKPSIMEQYLTYDAATNDAAHALEYALVSNMTIGKSYTIKALVENMIENSDNGAETLLISHANQKILNDIYHDLHIQVPTEVPDFTISPRNYSAFIRILYNSTYLTEKNSEEALSILSNTTFKSGIVAGIPSGTIASQKYGERIDTDESGNITALELHNCGIVYSPSPYQICIMTKGYVDATEEELASIIKDISTVVYQYTNSGKN